MEQEKIADFEKNRRDAERLQESIREQDAVLDVKSLQETIETIIPRGLEDGTREVGYLIAVTIMHLSQAICRELRLMTEAINFVGYRVEDVTGQLEELDIAIKEK